MSRKDMKPPVCRRQWVWGISDVWTNPDGPAGCGGSQNDGEMVIREVCGDGRSIRLVDMLFYDILAPWSACDACGRMVNQGPKTHFFHVWRIVFFHTQPAIVKYVIYSIGKYAKSTKGWYRVLFFSIDDILYMDSDYQWPWLSDYPSNIGLNSILAPIHNFLTLFLDCFLGFA